MMPTAYLTPESVYADVLVRKVAQSGSTRNWDRLLDRIEHEGWLASQAVQLSGFEKPSSQLEEHVLPYLVDRRDWTRFVRLAATAAQLRGMAEALEEGPVLRALVRGGRRPLARSLAARLPEPLRRARARAEIAALLPRQERDFAALSDEISRDLADAGDEGPSELPQAVRIARLLGLEKQGDLGPFFERWATRDETVADPLWRSLAYGVFRAEAPDGHWLWRALTTIRDLDAIPELVPDPEQHVVWWERIAHHFEGAHLRWRLARPSVEAACRRDPEGWAAAGRLLGPCPTSRDWVDLAWSLWSLLPESDARSVARRLGPTTRLALRVARVDGETPIDRVRMLLQAIRVGDIGRERLHLVLRLLEQGPRESMAELRGWVASVANDLTRFRYGVPAEDLARYLDLVAETHGSKVLRRQVEEVLWAPDSRAETLRCLTERGRADPLLEELFERTEEYAAMAAETNAEGFELRREALVVLTARLCVRHGDLRWFRAAGKRLLPEEGDGLAEEVAERLVAAGLGAQAVEVAESITDGRLQLRVILEAAPAPDEDRLAPAALYAAVADPRPVTDEVRSLSVLLRTPTSPDWALGAARDFLEDIRDPGRRVEALIDLAHHSMDHQEEHVSRWRRDFPAAVLPLKQALGVVPSDDWLLGITPELVRVGGRLGPREAVAEIREAWERIRGMESVSTTDRAWGLAELPAQVTALLPESERRRRRRLRRWLEERVSELRDSDPELLEALAGLQEVWDPKPSRDEDPKWLDRLAERIAVSEIDPANPREIPLRRRLWDCDCERVLPVLADATIHALATGGMRGGENALRWFVNAYLPAGECRSSAGAEDMDGMLRALEAAERIGPVS